MSTWAAYCAERFRFDMGRVVQSLDASAHLSFARSADGLRSLVMGSVPGEVGVIVGPLEEGVSDVNLAAAIANDGNARCVVLARTEVSGSLRSRAARAGIDQVIDLAEVGGEEARTTKNDGCGGGPPVSGDAAAPLPPASAGTRAPILTFCSGRGGVGKTSLVAVAAAHAASWGMRVMAVDLDLSCGNLYSLFGAARGTDLARLGSVGVPSAGNVGELFASVAPGIQVAGPCELPETSELALLGVGELLSRAAEASDLVLVDTSTTFTDAVAQAAQMSDRLVLVSDGRPGSVASLARSGGLAVRLGVARTRIARLENRANPRVKADLSLARAEVGLEAARVYRAFEGGDEVVELLGAGRATELVDSGIAFAESVATATAQLLAELGRLPENEQAKHAAQGSTTHRWPVLFGRAREAR